MCGIFGVFGKKQEFLKNIILLKKRGNDGSGFCTKKYAFKTDDFSLLQEKLASISNEEKEQGILIHALHALVGNIKQPIMNHDTGNKLVMNGEIYNWKELKKKYRLNGKNDAEILLEMLEYLGIDAEEKLDGVFSYAYWNQSENQIVVSRDMLGEKPLCYYYDDQTFAFASENKILDHQGVLLDPKKYIVYNTKTHALKIKNKKITLEKIKLIKLNRNNIKKKLAAALLHAFKERTSPLKKYGILFSGGIDSTFLAFLSKKKSHKSICYTAAFEDGNTRKAPDLEHAQKIAKKYGFILKTTIVSLNKLEHDLPKIMEIIESTDPVKVGVALPFYYCCNMAQKDGMKVVLSGLGSEELFAGYNRHFEVLKKNNFIYKNNEINKECLRGLLSMWERDLYRDDLITMYHTIELRLPFLDKKLINFALQIPEQYKINKEQKKIILREVAEYLGLAKDICQRPKLAAQYGSNFDKGLEKLAKKHSFKGKKEYLEHLHGSTK
ncbi:asparagine synthetase B [Candidatus Woesearchaeota archaeon]|nr:asparagine synthetase B [Candidatus Woesearchaeota archaeon]